MSVFQKGNWHKDVDFLSLNSVWRRFEVVFSVEFEAEILIITEHLLSLVDIIIQKESFDLLEGKK
jgi:hypothetical protein